LIRKTVTDLLTCATLYEITKGLFPYDEEVKEDLVLGKKFEEDHAKEENVIEGGKYEKNDNESEQKREDNESMEQNLTDGVSKLVESQSEDTINLEDHISQSIKGLSTIDSPEVSKEDEVINNIITQKFNTINDIELEERIQYCKAHAKRIIAAVEKGQNPQLNGNSVDAKPITDDDISKTIKAALDEYSDDEDGDLKFPELPKTVPGNEPDQEQGQDQGQDQDQHGDNDEEINKHSDPETETETTTTHHKHTSTSKSSSKQLKREDVTFFLQNGELLERATKSAKFAISAINYEDVDTAIAELSKSMAFLQQFKDRP